MIVVEVLFFSISDGFQIRQLPFAVAFLFSFFFFAVKLTNFRTAEKIPVRSSVQESQKERGLIFCLCLCVCVYLFKRVCFQ